jgi:RNA-directed DNA polymerase
MSNARLLKPMKEWNTIPWFQLERRVFKLQKRIFKASHRGDVKAVRRLQKTLLRSWSAKSLAVRRVSQDNQGKKTAGIDGMKSLNSAQRLELVKQLRLSTKGQATRRVWIPKPDGSQRPLGIPTMRDRALQALVKSALEPEWEAKFEPHSYGFRPGRNCHDAIEAIFNGISRKAKYVLDADIAKCFDQIDHEQLLTKLQTFPKLRRLIKGWLKSGVLAAGKWFPTSSGTPQGGVISPLLANIALHGMEKRVQDATPRHFLPGTETDNNHKPPLLIRYADDFVILHELWVGVEHCQQVVQEWLRPTGLELHPQKTQVTHTLKAYEGRVGFDFLGFTVRQLPGGKYRTGKNTNGQPLGFKTLIKPSQASISRHQEKLKTIIKRHQTATQSQLIDALSPVITGWSNYFSSVASSKVFAKLDNWLFRQLKNWAKHRHPHKSGYWIANRYWLIDRGEGWTFAEVTPNGTKRLAQHRHTAIERYVKVQCERSIFDADWLYWSTRLRRHPQTKRQVALLLKLQKGKCAHCRLFFTDKDLLEIDHILPITKGGRDEFKNLQLLHRHCHDVKSALDRSPGVNDNDQAIEEPDELKGSRPVLKTSGAGDSLAEFNL